MCDEKLSSNGVPPKFVEWLLAMGCPAQRVPSRDKISEMCRGQYYMVWRSLMEHVEARDVIRSKRLQVFCEDMRRCEKKNVLRERDIDVVVPEQLELWKRRCELGTQVSQARAQVALLRHDSDQLAGKVTRKVTQYNLERARLEDTQRRSWFLEHLAQELQTRRTNLEETRSIAQSLCSVEEDGDLQGKLDKCVTSLRRQTSDSVSALSTSVASSSVVSARGETEFEEQMHSLVRCRGDALCSQLCSRRSALVAALGRKDADPERQAPADRLRPNLVVSRTAAMLSTLALEAIKNRAHLKQAHKRLVEAVTELNNYLSGEYCELLVMRCEKAHMEARVNCLRALLGEITARSGLFQAGDETEARGGVVRPISAVDAAIEGKRDELRRVIGALATSERKVQSVRECLAAVFSGFRKDAANGDNDRYRGLQLDMPQEPIARLRQFYEARREARLAKVDLSLEFELSDCSFTEETANPRFVDELKVYLKKFRLEKNRKLVLDSGEKMWIFETLPASLSRLHSAWLAGSGCPPLAPGGSAAAALRRVAQGALARAALRECAYSTDTTARHTHVVEINSQVEEERQTLDKIKKRIGEDLVALQKTTSTLETGHENIKLWSDNLMRKHVSGKRVVDGMTYKEYEMYYLECCLP